MRLFFEIIIILVGIILGIEAFYPDTIFSEGRAYAFLNSNLFSALIIFIVGVFAIGLYISQKRDYKRGAAKLILQEIRYAEQQIRTAREQGYNYYLANKLLPTSSWHQNIHLFVKDLKETELDLISKFYSNAKYLDIIISTISDQKSRLLAPVNPVNPEQLIPVAPIDEDYQPQPQPQVQPQVQVRVQQFESSANKILKEVSGKIEFIYNTPVVNKLRDISEKKWYQLI